MHRPPHQIIRLILCGLVALAAGMALAHRALPEWRVEGIVGEDELAARFRTLLEPLGMHLEAGEPGAYLTTPELLPRGGGLPRAETMPSGLQIRMAHPAAWRGLRGGLVQIAFDTEGHPRSLDWGPLRLSTLFKLALGTEEDDLVEEELLPVVLESGEEVGEALRLEISGTEFCLFPILGSEPPEHVRVAVVSNLMIEMRRLEGDLAAGTRLLEELSLPRSGSRLALRGLLFVLVLGTFVVLLFLRRIDLRDGLVLALLSWIVSCAGAWSRLAEGLAGWQVLSTATFTAFFLFLLWSAAESWIRTTEPGFTTSFDMLRNGRLGPRSGRALLAGWGAGAALGGLHLALQTLAEILPWAYRLEASVTLPIFDSAGHPLYRGPVVAGLTLLALAAAHRLSPRRWRTPTAMIFAALLLASTTAVGPFPFALGTALPVAILLISTYRHFGLTAMFSTALVSRLLPAALLALRHPDWLAGSATVAGLLVLLIPILGLVALRRPPEKEREALVPVFVRRVEEERRLRYEMDLLVRMQVGMLPGAPPEIDGWELAAESYLATEAGGDLYDFLRDDEGHLWVAAGDVAGHGYACALELAMVKSSLHSVVSADLKPSEVLQRVDHALRASRSVRSFTSLVLLRLNLETGEALLSNAGHPYPLLATGDAVEEIALPGLPLGQGPPRSYPDHRLRIPPGAVLLLASDGLYEALDDSNEPYGFDRPRQHFGTLVGRSAQEILWEVTVAWRSYMGSQPANDDASLVVIRRL